MRSSWSHAAHSGQTVFTVGERDYQWIDVILAAYLWGEYARLERRTRDGLALDELWRAGGEEVPRRRRTRPPTRGAYDRDLLAADDAAAVARRSPPRHGRVGSNTSTARCSHARPTAPKFKVSAPEVEAALYGEGSLLGSARDLAMRLAGQAAAFDRLNEGASLGARGGRSRGDEAAARIGPARSVRLIRSGIVARAEFVAASESCSNAARRDRGAVDVSARSRPIASTGRASSARPHRLPPRGGAPSRASRSGGQLSLADAAAMGNRW